MVSGAVIPQHHHTDAPTQAALKFGYTGVLIQPVQQGFTFLLSPAINSQRMGFVDVKSLFG